MVVGRVPVAVASAMEVVVVGRVWEVAEKVAAARKRSQHSQGCLTSDPCMARSGSWPNP